MPSRLSLEQEEIVLYGLAQCSDWHSFLSYCRFRKPAMKYRAAQRLAARLWIEIKKKRAAVVENYCPVCDTLCEPADDDGHCSYSCASGGGWTAASVAQWAGAGASSALLTDSGCPGCYGCAESQPNQLAHMEPGGCLYQDPLEED